MSNNEEDVIMGWCGGASIAEEVWLLVREFVPTKDRKNIAQEIINIFRDRDADTMDEAEQLMADAEEKLE